jgi:hypothetical protein
MYNATTKQLEAEKTLKATGFKFSNWISAQTENENEGCMVMTRKPRRFSTEYREIDPEGNIN